MGMMQHGGSAAGRTAQASGSGPGRVRRRIPRRARRGGLDLYNVIFALLLIAISIGVVIGLYVVATGYFNATERVRLLVNIHAAMQQTYIANAGYGGGGGSGNALGTDVSSIIARTLPDDNRNGDAIEGPDGEIEVYENGSTYVVVFRDIDDDACIGLMRRFTGRAGRSAGVVGFGVRKNETGSFNDSTARTRAVEFTVQNVEGACTAIDDGSGALAITRR